VRGEGKWTGKTTYAKTSDNNDLIHLLRQRNSLVNLILRIRLQDESESQAT